MAAWPSADHRHLTVASVLYFQRRVKSSTLVVSLYTEILEGLEQKLGGGGLEPLSPIAGAATGLHDEIEC